MEIFFVQLFCVFLPLFNIICFCYIHTISVLYYAHLCMKYIEAFEEAEKEAAMLRAANNVSAEERIAAALEYQNLIAE